MFGDIPNRTIGKMRAYALRRKLTNKDGQIVFLDPFYKIKVYKGNGAKFIVNGKLVFVAYPTGDRTTFISLGDNSTLEINGDFHINSGVQIIVDKNGFLRIGGKGIERECGISSDSRIEVYKKIEIGKDFICGFNVYITDGDRHCVKYDDLIQNLQSDVLIGDHVWICHGTSILKGTKIGRGCIVGSKSLLSQKTFPENSLIAGIPAKIIKSSCSWQYDFPDATENT